MCNSVTYSWADEVMETSLYINGEGAGANHYTRKDTDENKRSRQKLSYIRGPDISFIAHGDNELIISYLFYPQVK